ncbi:MAG: Com family DNA-binding transcriptional regulator [Methylobacillus sp.]|nr:Com family DNA-binding transcriptional regulator [Methylobacillus sp.]
METIRCGKCNRKLAESDYKVLCIKCPRCGTMNVLKAKSLELERHRASPVKGTTDGKNKQTHDL